MNDTFTGRDAVERITEHYFSYAGCISPLVFIGDKAVTSAALSYVEERFRKAHPGAIIRRLPIEQFLNEHIDLFKMHGDRSAYEHELGQCDLLLLDNFEELGAYGALQESMYGILDNIYEHGRRAVIGMSRRLRDIPGLEDRNRAQLEGGLLWNLREYPCSAYGS